MQEFDAETINSVYLEFERLANRVERSSTYYQALGVEHGASLDELKHAYRNAVSLIQPVYSGRFQAVDNASQARAARILRKTSGAFAVLSNFGKRVEYDNLLFKKRPGLSPISRSDSTWGVGGIPGNTAVPVMTWTTGRDEQSQRLSGRDAAASSRMFSSEPATAKAPVIDVQTSISDAIDGNRRRFERFGISVPVSVEAHDRIKGRWGEVAQTLDVSRTGALLRTNLSLRHGSVVHLDLPLPVNLRSHGFMDPTYRVYAIARRIGPFEGGPRAIGLEFLGEKPPIGYLDRPWAAFRTDNWGGADRRREERELRSEVVSVKYLDESQSAFRQEVALTENVSQGGAMIYVKGAPPEVEFIRLANLNRSFESLARICDRYIGNDGLERISLQFIERKWLEA